MSTLCLLQLVAHCWLIRNTQHLGCLHCVLITDGDACCCAMNATGEVHPSCPRLLLNRVRVPALDACLRPGDAVCLGECDALVRCLAREMGLQQVLEERVVACKAEHAACRPYSAVAQAD
jgi:hypothetical protein